VTKHDLAIAGFVFGAPDAVREGEQRPQLGVTIVKALALEIRLPILAADGRLAVDEEVGDA
jgi:hypothetical protein